MTSTDKSDLSSGFLWCALYILLMALTREVLEVLPLQPWLLAAPQIIAAALCLRLYRKAGQSLRWKGQSDETLAMRVALIVLGAAGLAAFQSLFPAPRLQGVDPAAWLFAAVIAAPAAEEVFFRGMLFARSRAGIRIPLQALLFAAAHMQLEQGLFALAGGLVFGWLALEFGLLAAIACHGLANLFSILVVLSKEPMPPVLSVVFVLAALAGFLYMKVRK